MTTPHNIPKLILVTDRKRALHPLPQLAQMALAGGVDLIQIREKDLSQNDLAILISEVVNTVGDPSKIAVNGSPGLAAQFGIGLHLPESGPSPSTARSIVGPDTLTGRSVHSTDSAQNSTGANYLIAGHVFASTSKPGLPPLGLPGLRSIVESTTLPVIAIGGITANNLTPILDSGAYGIAVISAINNAPNPEHAARTILDSLLKQAYLTERGDFSPAQPQRSS